MWHMGLAASQHLSSLATAALEIVGAVAQPCSTFCNSVDCYLPGSSVHGILRQEYWSGLSFPSPGDLFNPGTEPGSPALQAESLPSEPLEGGFLIIGPPGKSFLLGLVELLSEFQNRTGSELPKHWQGSGSHPAGVWVWLQGLVPGLPHDSNSFYY